MNVKTLKLHVIGFCIIFCPFIVQAGNSIWDSSPVGRCFPSIEKYLADSFGVEYTQDENIHVMDASVIPNAYKWVYDATPEKNITRVLFQISEGGKACAILFVPAASTITPRLPFEKLPKRFISLDSPPPGFATTEIKYKLLESGLYTPYGCSRLLGKRRRQIDCEELLLE